MRIRAVLLGLLLGAPFCFSQPVTSQGTAERITRGASLPATCNVGDVFFKTTATIGSYQCKTANTWTVIGSGSVTAADVANTPAGTIAATTVQAAIDELASEKGALVTCTAQFVRVIGASSSTCESIADADVPNNITITLAATATALATPRAIYGNNFDGSAALAQIIAAAFGGTGNGFTKFSGPATSEKTFTLPNSSETLLYAGGALGTPASGVATNLTGTAAGLTAGTASAVAVGGITGLGSGVGTFLATPSGANLASALTTALPLSKGGTNATSFTAAKCVRVNAGGTALEAAADDCGSGGSDELGCTTTTSQPTTGTAYTCVIRTDTTPDQLWIFIATDTPVYIPFSDDITIAGRIALPEASANGSNFRRFLVPDALTADLTVKFPNTVPTANNVMCFPAPTADVSEFTFVTLDSCNGVVKGNLSTRFPVHDTGGDDTYAANPIGGSGYCPAAYADGLMVEFVADTTNTGAATLDLCGLGALEISAALAGTDLSNGDLVVGKPYLLRYYDAGTDLWIVTLPGADGGGGYAYKTFLAGVCNSQSTTVIASVGMTVLVSAGAGIVGPLCASDADVTLGYVTMPDAVETALVMGTTLPRNVDVAADYVATISWAGVGAANDARLGYAAHCLQNDISSLATKTYTPAGKGYANYTAGTTNAGPRQTTITGIAFPADCAAGQQFTFSVWREGGDAGDTIGNVIYVYSVDLELPLQ